jgi:AraC-like DNA-binding protein
MQELEHISGLSTMQIERYFKKLFQVTPSQYIQKVRVEKAIELLKENFSITEISSRCGYADHSAFTRQFKQVLGMPPSEFKQQYLKQDTHL